MFSEDTKKEWEVILNKYPVKRSALIPILHNTQKELGYVSEDAMENIADYLDLHPAEVYETATFYTMFNMTPIGRYHILVCRTLSCHLVGAASIIDHIKKKLDIELGGTSSDNMFTLSTAECLASCGTAPMMQINDDYYENLTLEKVDQILDELRVKAQEAVV